MAKRRASGEGSIRKRKDGRWEGRYTAGHDPKTGKPIYKNVLAKTQAEVRNKLKQAIADAEKLDFARADGLTVKAWIKNGMMSTPSPGCGRRRKNTTITTLTTTSSPNWATSSSRI